MFQLAHLRSVSICYNQKCDDPLDTQIFEAIGELNAKGKLEVGKICKHIRHREMEISKTGSMNIIIMVFLGPGSALSSMYNIT